MFENAARYAMGDHPQQGRGWRVPRAVQKSAPFDREL
jgi:hypothetical protein